MSTKVTKPIIDPDWGTFARTLSSQGKTEIAVQGEVQEVLHIYVNSIASMRERGPRVFKITGHIGEANIPYTIELNLSNARTPTATIAYDEPA